MKLPLAWLRDYLTFDLTADELAERLASLGFPVESIDRPEALHGVVVGRLTLVAKHPNADRLSVCTVDIGEDEPLTIATAATNVATGDVVPVAKIGAHVVGLDIAPRAMRGIASQGMLCSAAEVGLEAAWFVDGILQLEKDAEVGADFIAAYGLGEAVLDVEVTANRVDAMSVLGLARELGAGLGLAIREPSIAAERLAPDPTPPETVVLESPDCTRFVAQRISDVTVGEAPFWMRVRLALAGQRPIDSLVDVTNFVMLEGAQPLHAYDAARVARGRLIVRDARPGEKIMTLDGTERTLDARFLAIADDGGVQCVAGLMGAASSEIGPQTTDVIIESATFAGPRIRRMSVALGLRTEASSRHEKGLPRGLATWGAARAAHLLEAQGATVRAPYVAGAGDEPPAAIDLDVARIATILGIAVEAAEARGALEALGFVVTLDGARLSAFPPPWRGDVRIPEDLVEEIARIVGYDRLAAVEPEIVVQSVPSDAYRAERLIAHELAALGYREAIALALVSGSIAQTYARAGIALEGAPVEIVNPLTEDHRYLRFSLVPGLLANAARYAGDGTLRTFEIGHVFSRPHADGTNDGAGDTSAAVTAEADRAPRERAVATWLFATRATDEPAWQDRGFSTFKGECEALIRALTGRPSTTERATSPGLHPGKSATLSVDGTALVAFGALDPRLLAAYKLDGRVYAATLAIDALPPYAAPAYRAPSKFPALVRDLALVVSHDVAAAAIETSIRAAAPDRLASVRVFDEFRGSQLGENEKSLAVRVTLQRPDATLTDRDADETIAAILRSLDTAFGAKLRG